MSTALDVQVRPLEERDLAAVVRLLTAALGPGPGGADRGELFAWKHFANPFGRSIGLVAESGGRLVALRAFMRWRLVTGDGREIEAVRAVDTAVDPSLQRRGLFSRLTREALELCRQEGVALVFNTPNRRSLPGYLKMGWREVATWPLHVRMRRRVRVAGAAIRRDLQAGGAVEPPAGSPLVAAGEALQAASPPAGDALGAASPPAGDATGAPPLAADALEASGPSAGALWTPRTPEYLSWRYTRGPLPYHVLAERDARVVVRLRGRGRLREAVVCDAFGDGVAALLRRVPEAARADHAVASAAPASRSAADLRRAGYRRVPRVGMRFVVRPLTEEWLRALDPAAWALTLGDLEVF